MAISKHPLSPDYVCATLGVSILIFLALGHLRGWLARQLLDFGRTPLFTYVGHIYIANSLMLAAEIALGTPQAAISVVAGNPPAARRSRGASRWELSMPCDWSCWCC